MRTSLSELRKPLCGKPYLLSAFRYKSLVIFCDGCMTFVYGLVNNNGLAEYTRSVKVVLSPRLPDDVEITSMSAMQDGSLVALSASSSLFIVRVSADLWSSRASGHVPHNEYVCELQEVHPTLFDSPKPPKVVRVRWILADSITSSVHLLAVLFDDNRIRIYQAENVCDMPCITVDYCSFMCASDRPCDGYGSNSYGLFKSIVSFDVVVLSDECPVIFAVDSEGKLYSTTINVNGASSPLTRPLISPSSLPCDPVDLRIVDHPMNALFSVFAVLSLSNAVCFLVAVPDDHSNYSLFVQEHLQLAQTSFWSLCASDFESTILVANDSTVFHLDLSPWLQEYSSILSGSSSVTSQSAGKNSSVRELLVTADDGKAYVCSPCTSRERAVGMICTSTNPRESTTMFVACTQNPPLATAFLRKKLPESHDLDSAVAPTESLSQLNEKALNAILSKRESLAPIRKGATHQQVIKNLSDFFDTAKRNQIVLSAALEMSKDRLSVLVKLATQLAERQNTVNQRLLQVFRQNVAIKDRNEQLRLDVSKTLSRVDKVSACLADDRKLSADEVKLFGRLKEYRAKMLTNSLKISRLSIEAAQLQREARGPARPFTASASANLFVLQYTDEELTALRDRLERLSSKFDGFRSRNITDNKENLGISN